LGELYLFITYALPLTVLSTAFGSDCPMLSHLGFPLNFAIIICIITYAHGNLLTPLDQISGMKFATQYQ